MWLHSLQVTCRLRCHRCSSTESRSDTWHSMSSYWVTVMSLSLSYASDWAGLGKVWTVLRCLMRREVFHHLTRLTWLQRNVLTSLRVKYQEVLIVIGWDASDYIWLLTVEILSKVKTIHQTICWQLESLTSFQFQTRRSDKGSLLHDVENTSEEAIRGYSLPPKEGHVTVGESSGCEETGDEPCRDQPRASAAVQQNEHSANNDTPFQEGRWNQGLCLMYFHPLRYPLLRHPRYFRALLVSNCIGTASQ